LRRLSTWRQPRVLRAGRAQFGPISSTSRSTGWARRRAALRGLDRLRLGVLPFTYRHSPAVPCSHRSAAVPSGAAVVLLTGGGGGGGGGPRGWRAWPPCRLLCTWHCAIPVRRACPPAADRLRWWRWPRGRGFWLDPASPLSATAVDILLARRWLYDLTLPGSSRRRARDRTGRGISSPAIFVHTY